MDQPTPAGSATRDSVQDVIARAIFEFDVPDVDPNIEAHALSIRIQESLAAAGYRVVEAGEVTLTADSEWIVEYQYGGESREPKPYIMWCDYQTLAEAQEAASDLAKQADIYQSIRIARRDRTVISTTVTIAAASEPGE